MTLTVSLYTAHKNVYDVSIFRSTNISSHVTSTLADKAGSFFYASEEREAGSNGAHLLFSVGHWDGVITLIDLAFVCGLPTLLD